jgi:hypothetical protein
MFSLKTSQLESQHVDSIPTSSSAAYAISLLQNLNPQDAVTTNPADPAPSISITAPSETDVSAYTEKQINNFYICMKQNFGARFK